jgi:hypothetical protein
MLLGPCDTVSKLYCFENDKREPVDYNIIFLYDTRTMSQYIKYIKIKRHHVQKKMFVFEKG